MKKTVNINLGGKPFVIDEDAYYEMQKYLNAIEKHFSHSEGFEDIMDDIEVRIAELLEEGNAGQIITKQKLESVKGIMGRPKDFGSFADDSHTHNRGHRGTIPKRLFRDPENKVIAGVCSGLATRLGIEDPIVIRIIFVLLGIFSLGIFIYLILWIAVPYAKTRNDFLSMKGMDVTIQNIAKSLEDGFLEIKDTFEEISDDFKSKMTK